MVAYHTLRLQIENMKNKVFFINDKFYISYSYCM